MAIQFRCEHCQTLMSIATRKAGSVVRCAACDEEVLVPLESRLDRGETLAAPVPPVDEEQDRVALPDDLFDFDDDEPASSKKPASRLDDDADGPPQNIGEFTGYEFPVSPPVAEEPAPAAENSDSPPRSRASDEDEHEKFVVQLRKSSIDDEMDLTPMVDVVFQLLIFFMVTASFALHKTIQTPTPESNQKGATQSIQSLDELEGVAILVRIDAHNGIVVDDDPVADDSRIADVLLDKMRKELKSEIIITADAAAWHRTVVKVVDAANEVGMQKIRLATYTGADE